MRFERVEYWTRKARWSESHEGQNVEIEKRNKGACIEKGPDSIVDQGREVLIA